MMRRSLPALGFGAPALFWIALFAFAALRPEYSHLGNPVSELGALRTPNMLAWNLVGFGLAGAALLVFGWTVGRELQPARRWMPALLASGGLCLMLTAVFPADLADLRGTLTRLHIVASLVGLLWIPGAIWFAVAARRRWPAASAVTAVAAVLFIGSILVLEELPSALAQRLRFAAWMSWYPAMAWVLWKQRPDLASAPHP